MRLAPSSLLFRFSHFATRDALGAKQAPVSVMWCGRSTMCLKRKVYNECVLPLLTYEAENLPLKKQSNNRMIEAHMYAKTNIRNMHKMSKMIKICVVAKIASHLATTCYGRWTRKISECKQRDHAFPKRGRRLGDLKLICPHWMNDDQDIKGTPLREVCSWEKNI